MRHSDRLGRSRRTNHDFGLAAAAVVGYLALFQVVRRGETDALDRAVAVRLQRCRAPWLDRAMSGVSWFGFPPQSQIVPPLVAAVHWTAGRRLDAAFQLAAWGTAPLAAVAKEQMRRPRPLISDVQIARGALDGSSFPSGHVLSYLGVYGFLAYRVSRSAWPAWARHAVVAAIGALVALVGPSRIYLGHHWPTDTLASYLLGAGYLLGLVGLYRRALARRGTR